MGVATKMLQAAHAEALAVQSSIEAKFERQLRQLLGEHETQRGQWLAGRADALEEARSARLKSAQQQAAARRRLRVAAAAAAEGCAAARGRCDSLKSYVRTEVNRGVRHVQALLWSLQGEVETHVNKLSAE
eukprot:652388-Pleurochrysis_carterae.AAC.2